MQEIRQEECPAGNGGETTEVSAPAISAELAAAAEAGLITPETFEWLSVQPIDEQVASAKIVIDDASKKRDALMRYAQLVSDPAEKSGHAGISEIPLSDIRPSPENDKLYRPISDDDPDIISLAESIRRYGVKEPLVVTLDGFILSGHRRYAAARLAGLDAVPCRTENISHEHDHDQLVKLLRECNRHREKSLDEKLNEIVVESSTEEAYDALVEARRARARVNDVVPMVLTGTKKRAEISKAKFPMLSAIKRILEERRDYWPLTDRVIHYALLNDPPLRHASKPKSTYQNNENSYDDLTDLLTRARLAGLIPWEAIDDETRPVVTWDVFDELSVFIRRERERLFRGYARNLMRSQPNHIEIVGEKNTVRSVVNPVAMDFTIPYTLGRGYCSLPPRKKIAERFHRSGKEKLILLMLSDYDPDGEEIAHSFARSMRDDFLIPNIHPIKVALTGEHVEQFNLPPMLTAKKSSSNYDKFSQKHGNTVFELEAMTPQQLQQVLRESIESVIDTDAFNREVEAEKQDAAKIAMFRTRVDLALAGIAA